ncbi:MAG: protein kinase [Gammaproteobacteria bacterium]|nr:protein kinase [Gammaproteobacteria bacterium]MDH3362906.1 protein kinase [Gammaproteobacteria bacterium]MDH3481050.1 protein kinase [Gammaproteobacteria bacterium]
MPQLSKGTQLADRYTLDRRLGGGGEAETWLAKDRLTGAAVALKIAGETPGAAERLREEWQTNIRLVHAHIVRVFEFHGDADRAFYSQQYIDGPDLSELSGEPLQQVLGPIGLIADALRYAHGKGIVHRDIKASNILLDRNGAPYLSDFGVSAKIGSPKSGGSLIARSPQSLAGEAAQPADDIFALGGLIYDLVSGRSPYSSSRTADDIRNHAPALRQAADGSDVPLSLRRLVASMLDKDAAKRPDAEGVAEQLRTSGFSPGPARIKIAARPTVVDERVDTIESIHPASLARTTAQSEMATVSQPGISAKTLGIALGALLLLLLAVVFLLPKTVSTDAPPTAARQPGLTGTTDSAANAVEDGDLTPGQRRAKRDHRPESRGIGGEEILFNENEADYSGLDESGRARFNAEMILGELLSNFETLERRSVQRWAGVQFKRAQELYAAGDKAYLERDYAAAERHYLDAISAVEPLFDRIEPEFQKALTGAQAAFEAGDRPEALRLYELAVAITPNSPVARAGYERTRNLQSVLQLVEQGLAYEKDLELDAAEASFSQAVKLDPLWEPAAEGLARVQRTRLEMEFDLRMSEGLAALAAGDYLAARAAFRMAESLIPGSPEPADGLLQVDQGLRLDNISALEQEALSLEQDEHWEAVATTYEEILKIDGNLSFAIDGLSHAREMSALHKQLDEYLSDPDKLSNPPVMQKATSLVVDITRMQDIGARLAAQRDELSRLLKRAATPVPVALLSDNLTNVSVYKVGNLGNFRSRELELRPGTYVAVGVRPGFRDVRLEFRVAPEIEMEPVVVRCEEAI